MRKLTLAAHRSGHDSASDYVRALVRKTPDPCGLLKIVMASDPAAIENLLEQALDSRGYPDSTRIDQLVAEFWTDTAEVGGGDE